MRIGARQKPFYRVVVIDERSKRNGAYVELLGTYNPLTQPKEIKLNKERVEHWLKQGAQKSDGFLRILGEAPQRPPRKPKKEKKVEEPKPEEKPAEETQPVTEEANVSEEAKSETAKASGEVEPTPEVNESNPEQGATQTSSESTGETSSALQPDEPTITEAPVEEENKKDERPA